MRKITSLLMFLCLFVGTAWAQTAEIKVSKNVSNPEWQYVIKNKNNVWMNSYTSTTQTKPGKFAFFASGDDYQIYSVDRQKWVSYEKAESYSGGVNKIVLVDDQTKANTWKATQTKNNGVDVYQFSPYKNSGVASIYMNWHGGTDSYPLDNETKTVGFYGHHAGQDAGSAWILSELTVPTASKKYVLQEKSGVYLDLVNLGEEPSHGDYNQLATLGTFAKPLYITVDNDNVWSWSIHTDAEGGKYLHQYTSDRQWNSKVSEDGATFRWKVETVVANGEWYYQLKHESGTQNGYLSSSTPENATPLYVNNGADIALKLKIKEYQEGYLVVGPEGAVVTYNGNEYAIGETVVPEGELSVENLDVTAPERNGYQVKVSVDNANNSIVISYELNLQAGHKLILKNRQHNTYLGVMFEGGKLDNSTEPTTKKLAGSTTNNNYKNCWQLVAVPDNETPCFYLYNPYYDWYASPISERNKTVHLSKSTDGAGYYLVESVGDYAAFKCLNGANTGHVYLHQVDWGNYTIVDWDRDANASQWAVEVISEETENNWLTAVTTEVANKKAYLEARELGTELGQYSGMNADEKSAALETLSIPTEGTAAEKIKIGVHALYSIPSIHINIPTAGFYRIKSMNANDANKKGKYWQSKADASGMELAAEKDDARSIIYLGENNSVTSYGCGYALNQYAGMDAAGTVGKAWTITENATVVATYALFRNGDGYCLSDWTGNATYGQNDANAAWMLEEVTELPVTISAAGYATFYTPIALTLPTEGLKAYTVTVNGDRATLNAIDGNVIPAETGVVLEGAEGDYALTVGGDATAVEGNELLGTVAASNITEAAYVLGYVGEEGKKEVGFYTAALNVSTDKTNDGTKEAPAVTYEAWLNNGFKAYLPKTGVAATLRFNFGGTTAIESVLNNGVDANAPIYDLSGRRVMNAVKGGIYIQNGKKFIVK